MHVSSMCGEPEYRQFASLFGALLKKSTDAAIVLQHTNKRLLCNLRSCYLGSGERSETIMTNATLCFDHVPDALAWEA